MSTCDVRVKTWLSSTWHIKVPDPWLEACINWIQEENGGSSVSQAEVNKQVFEQWLLTDLRDLEYPILPAGVLDSLKFELNGFYAIQMDSLVDVSLPAYSQLQKLRGRENANDQVTAITQATQHSWESKPSRMLMLQLTDGIQNIQGMEYQTVPVLHAGLPPGTKILLQGVISCRLGVLLLKPENVKVLGGEVEALVAEHSQDKVLSRLIGMEEEALPQQTLVQNQVTARPQEEIVEAIDLSDEDLLASLNENEELTINNNTVPESGYYSRSEISSHASGISYTERQQTQVSNSRRTVPTANETIQATNMDEVYDLDDELFLEEEIERELEEMALGQPEITDNSFARIVSSTANPTNTPSTNQTSIPEVVSGQLDLPPFTYLSTVLTYPSTTVKCVQLKSFIVTLNGNLTSSSGIWSIKAKISDGTGYLDVEFNNNVLTKLIGFTVPEMKRLKKDPSQQKKLLDGLQKCQRELTDFCGIMTISYNPTTSEASVLALQEVSEETSASLRRRINR
ncbi:recQ-mediated genome instability protein 1 isoform X2 [Hyla sarda]|nr:recQ-mediated genome instability protein 1 isoform X2 [Hyla sarda]XP_056380059.1 recQ-mediated genome instability protein 1 isoform X2 [Hyla sarda]XP_056380068.1 recQ-mediated genome instability protein 1 isoform X2 [Hyla sarda]XP_056380078.1 recQ-mediated genome instability protein 1 isoform X2 [Hyla sarda]XP_056380084.1 recQ-mediated genome instability protein 1 isoform X2 [Hyla sarda]XP_056380090.1 recQ-mediated genome instability protein 1 isoform X2 [Hyla sarda]XP_056380099.1 recQ-med